MSVVKNYINWCVTNEYIHLLFTVLTVVQWLLDSKANINFLAIALVF